MHAYLHTGNRQEEGLMGLGFSNRKGLHAYLQGCARQDWTGCTPPHLDQHVLQGLGRRILPGQQDQRLGHPHELIVAANAQQRVHHLGLHVLVQMQQCLIAVLEEEHTACVQALRGQHLQGGTEVKQEARQGEGVALSTCRGRGGPGG